MVGETVGWLISVEKWATDLCGAGFSLFVLLLAWDADCFFFQLGTFCFRDCACAVDMYNIVDVQLVWMMCLFGEVTTPQPTSTKKCHPKYLCNSLPPWQTVPQSREIRIPSKNLKLSYPNKHNRTYSTIHTMTIHNIQHQRTRFLGSVAPLKNSRNWTKSERAPMEQCVRYFYLSNIW